MNVGSTWGTNRLGTAVNAHVFGEIAFLNELFVALLTFMHLLAGVRALMTAEMS